MRASPHVGLSTDICLLPPSGTRSLGPTTLLIMTHLHLPMLLWIKRPFHSILVFDLRKKPMQPMFPHFLDENPEAQVQDGIC